MGIIYYRVTRTHFHYTCEWQNSNGDTIVADPPKARDSDHLRVR